MLLHTIHNIGINFIISSGRTLRHSQQTRHLPCEVVNDSQSNCWDRSTFW